MSDTLYQPDNPLLSQSASLTPPPPRSSWRRWGIPAAILLLILIGVGAFFLLRKPSTSVTNNSKITGSSYVVGNLTSSTGVYSGSTYSDGGPPSMIGNVLIRYQKGAQWPYGASVVVTGEPSSFSTTILGDLIIDGKDPEPQKQTYSAYRISEISQQQTLVQPNVPAEAYVNFLAGMATSIPVTVRNPLPIPVTVTVRLYAGHDQFKIGYGKEFFLREGLQIGAQAEEVLTVNVPAQTKPIDDFFAAVESHPAENYFRYISDVRKAIDANGYIYSFRQRFFLYTAVTPAVDGLSAAQAYVAKAYQTLPFLQQPGAAKVEIPEAGTATGTPYQEVEVAAGSAVTLPLTVYVDSPLPKSGFVAVQAVPVADYKYGNSPTTYFFNQTPLRYSSEKPQPMSGYPFLKFGTVAGNLRTEDNYVVVRPGTSKTLTFPLHISVPAGQAPGDYISSLHLDGASAFIHGSATTQSAEKLFVVVRVPGSAPGGVTMGIGGKQYLDLINYPTTDGQPHPPSASADEKLVSMSVSFVNGGTRIFTPTGTVQVSNGSSTFTYPLRADALFGDGTNDVHERFIVPPKTQRRIDLMLPFPVIYDDAYTIRVNVQDGDVQLDDVVTTVKNSEKKNYSR